MVKSTDQFIGFDGFVWFQGVVENRIDPLKLGRVQVRVLGIHTDEKTNIPTADLPWAYPMVPITSASMNGIGDAPVGPVEGTWVVGFFRDGQNCQEPVIMGTIGGIPQAKANPSIGFNDPYGKYPLPNFIPEADTNRLARNENISDTIVGWKENNRDTGVPTALDADKTWDEPHPFYNAEYPYNHVFQSESGHVYEMDDTENNERIGEYHRIGTFYEIGPDGKKITKVNNDNYQIICGGDYVHIKGICDVTIGGDCNLLVNGAANIEVNKDVTANLKGDVKVTIGGGLYVDVADNVGMQVGGDINTLTAGDTVINSVKSIQLSADTSIQGSAGGTIEMAAQSNASLISALGDVDIVAGITANVGGAVGVDIGSLAEIDLVAPVINLIRVPFL